MTNHITRSLASAAAAAALLGAAVAPAAQAHDAGRTVKVTADHAYVDNQGPGRVFIGTVQRGDSFKIDRVVTVKSGSAKGRWYHGVAHISGKHALDAKGHERPFDLKGWVKASAF